MTNYKGVDQNARENTIIGPKTNIYLQNNPELDAIESMHDGVNYNCIYYYHSRSTSDTLVT